MSTTDIAAASDAVVTPPAPLWNSGRLAFTICAFFAVNNLMLVKMNTNFALICMTKNGTVGPEFNWGNNIQGHILSSFFYGYLVALLLGAWLSQKISAKLCFVAGNAVGGAINFLLPTLAYGGVWCFCVARVIQGMAMGIMLPSIQLIFASWTHIDERTKLLSFSCIGYNVGATLAYPMTSLFCESHQKWGWAFSYFFTGTFTTACAIAFYFFVFDSVHQHPRISAIEKEYILSGLGAKEEKKAIPYKRIFTSIPIYAYFGAHFCQVFGYAAISQTQPLFFHQALGLSVIQNGFLSSLPFILSTIVRFIIGQYFEPVRRLTRLSLTRFRKVNHAMGTLIPATLFAVIAILSDYDLKYQVAIIVLFCLIDCICDLGYCASYLPSLIDIAPSFTGLLSGIATSVANLPFIINAQIFGYLQKGGGYAPIQQWKGLWYTCSGVYVVGCIVYILFGTSVKQRWG